MALSSKGNIIIDDGEHEAKEYAPKSLKISYDSLAKSNSGRADNGTMVINWVRRNIRKLEIVMPPMKASQVDVLLRRVAGKTYNLTFWDIRTGTEVTVQMYTSNASGECYSGVLYDGLYTGVEFHAIEV